MPFSLFHLLSFFFEDNAKNLNQLCSGRLPLFVHFSLYRGLTLTFPWDICGLSLDGNIKSQMGYGTSRRCPHPGHV